MNRSPGEQTDVRTVSVGEEEAGQKLLQFLARRTGAPQAAIHKWIRSGQVRVDKARAKPFQRLSQGQSVRIPPHKEEEQTASPALPGLDIVHQDEDILVLAKPAGLPSHGGTGHGDIRHGDSVAARLAGLFPDALFTPTLAHRLDKATSGLLVAGKTYLALRRLQERMGSGQAGKTYLAWATGVWPEKVTELKDRLEKTGLPGEELVRVTDTGKEARTEVRLLEARDTPAGPASLLALTLLTGRTHQLRAQLAECGHPIVGDIKYGGPQWERMLLHAARLDLRPDGPLLTLLPDWPGPFRVAPDQMPS